MSENCFKVKLVRFRYHNNQKRKSTEEVSQSKFKIDVVCLILFSG